MLTIGGMAGSALPTWLARRNHCLPQWCRGSYHDVPQVVQILAVRDATRHSTVASGGSIQLFFSIINWNVEWARSGSRRGSEIVQRIERLKPNLACITETGGSLFSYGHTITSTEDYGYRPVNGRRKVLLWSQNPWTDVDTVGDSELPAGRFVRGVTSTPLGEITVLGLCIPWKDAHVQTGRRDRQRWEDHAVYLRVLARVLTAAPRQGLIVLGDFNQTIPRTRAPQAVHALLTSALGGLQVATAGPLDGIASLLIDHICHTNDLVCRDLDPIDNFDAGGRPLSDHVGTLARLESSR